MKKRVRAAKRERKNKRPRSNDSSDSDNDSTSPHVNKKPKQSNEQTPNQETKRFSNTKEVIRTRDFKLNLWAGPPGEENPSEETKLLRKSIGVNVRGNCQDSPPPLLSLDNDYIPSIFKSYCQQNHITDLTPIQKQSWPTILNGANIIGISPTGSGKTLAFALPAIQHILSAPPSSYRSNKATPFVLVLAPARELAIQIHAVFKSCRQIANSVKAALLYGGQEKQQQIDQIRTMGTQCKVLVATPGRLLDVMQDPDCPLDLNQVSYQVIDEADRMLAMGFLEQIQDVSTYMHPARQILLFSATFPGKLREVCALWIPTHVMIRVNAVELADNRPNKPDQSTIEAREFKEDTDTGVKLNSSSSKEREIAVSETDAEVTTSNEKLAIESEISAPSHSLHASALTVSPTIQQVIHVCAAHKKPRLLIKFIERIRANEKEEKKRQADPMIVFCNKIKTLTYIQSFLKKNNIACVALHGNIPQSQREENLSNFRSGKINLLLSTDVAARGIHIKRLKYVVNYDFPTNLEQYCHRIGRCGRPGTESGGLSSSVVAGAGTTAKSDMSGFAYSLMTRNMAPLSNDLIALLHSVNQSPEPNLQRLADDFNSGNFSFEGEEIEEGGAEEVDVTENDD